VLDDEDSQIECRILEDGEISQSWPISRGTESDIVINWLTKMSEGVDYEMEYKVFGTWSQPELVSISGRNMLVFKTDGFSMVDHERDHGERFKGEYTRSKVYSPAQGIFEDFRMTFLIFYDLDQNKIVDQIYGGEKYLGHT
jgi:hypothetical protein